MTPSYADFINRKTHLGGNYGFAPTFIPDAAFDFQRHSIEWAVNKGRAALFYDCGMGKSLMELVYAENVVRHTNKPVLLLTPLSVGIQMDEEAAKFGVFAARSTTGKHDGKAKVVITNYEKLHMFDPNDFAGTVCDESSRIKSVDGVTKAAVTEFMRKQKFGLLCTATAAPNDYIELGTSSEALGYLGFSDMLSKFFKKAEATTSRSQEHRSGIYRFRGHAERDFWRWVCSWARAVRKPSDLGFSDGNFKLPELITREHIVEAKAPLEGMLFSMPAHGLAEQRQERGRTIQERCGMASDLINARSDCSIAWCHLNSEGDLLEKMIPNSRQIAGKTPDEEQEEIVKWFLGANDKTGQRVLIGKPQQMGFGLNFQHCHHQTFFPSHSFEQWYQAVRRCWRFGQKHPVTIDVITSEGERGVLQNLQRKAAQAEEMFSHLVALMNNEMHIAKKDKPTTQESVPPWL